MDTCLAQNLFNKRLWKKTVWSLLQTILYGVQSSLSAVSSSTWRCWTKIWCGKRPPRLSRISRVDERRKQVRPISTCYACLAESHWVAPSLKRGSKEAHGSQTSQVYFLFQLNVDPKNIPTVLKWKIGAAQATLWPLKNQRALICWCSSLS